MRQRKSRVKIILKLLLWDIGKVGRYCRVACQICRHWETCHINYIFFIYLFFFFHRCCQQICITRTLLKGEVRDQLHQLAYSNFAYVIWYSNWFVVAAFISVLFNNMFYFTETKAGMNNHIHYFMLVVLSHPYPNFNSGLAKWTLTHCGQDKMAAIFQTAF